MTTSNDSRAYVIVRTPVGVRTGHSFRTAVESARFDAENMASCLPAGWTVEAVTASGALIDVYYAE